MKKLEVKREVLIQQFDEAERLRRLDTYAVWDNKKENNLAKCKQFLSNYWGVSLEAVERQLVYTAACNTYAKIQRQAVGKTRVKIVKEVHSEPALVLEN